MTSSHILVRPREESQAYPILINQSILDCLNWLPKKKFSQIVIITDKHIKKLYGLRLKKQLQDSGHQTFLLSFSPGEKSKNYQTKQRIEHAMHQHYCDKETLILALGGGVVGDVAGFIAATYSRGIAYVQIPTSLIAMVDSSIGGKTGINTRDGKNLIGSIYQPLCVVTDTSLLKTLPQKHLINGLIECIKMFLTHDEKNFHYLETHLDSILQGNEIILNKVIRQAIRIKADVVSRDAKDHAERNTLNFGHTIGHALEKLSNYTLIHGYAVAYGILVEATISWLLGFLNIESLRMIKNLLAGLGFCGRDLQKYDFDQLICETKVDKKNRLGKVNYVLLMQIGCVYVDQQQFIHAVNDDIVKQALEKFFS